MLISDIKEKYRARLENPSFPEIERWKADHPGGKAIGYFPIYVPVELIRAAGMLPVLVSGAMGKVSLDEADGALQSFVCSVGRSTLELDLGGYLDGLDGMVFPSTCEISRALSGVWTRRGEEKPVIYLHYPQNRMAAGARVYLVNELTRMKSMLEEIGGKEITVDAMNEAITVYNERAELLGRLDKFRSEHPERFSASEFYVIKLAGMADSPEGHSEILRETLKELEHSEPKYSPEFRVMMIGTFCEKPPVTMLEIIEREGIAIVYDDLLLGAQWWKKPLPITDNPIEAIAEHYLHQVVPNSVVYNQTGTRCEGLEPIMKERRADGILLVRAKACQPAHHDLACMARMCEKEKIPYISMEYEEDQRVFESLRVQVEALLEARYRFPDAGTEKV